MSDTDGSLIRRAAAAACLVLAFALPVAAQQLPVAAPAPAAPEFMTRYDFHLGAAGLAIDDPRFKWDTHFGGSIDMVDYVKGRAGVVIDYEAVLGNQLRPFDPNQGNYTLETSASWRLAGLEAAFVFHHVSRHLGDRPKDFAVAYNTAGGRLIGHTARGGITIDMTADIAKVAQHSFVDYSWIGDGEVTVRRPINTRAGVYVRGFGQVIGVDSASRGTQTGGLFEGGIRLNGTAGAIELFAGIEKRIDAYQLDRVPEHWALAGFRLVR